MNERKKERNERRKRKETRHAERKEGRNNLLHFCGFERDFGEGKGRLCSVCTE